MPKPDNPATASGATAAMTANASSMGNPSRRDARLNADGEGARPVATASGGPGKLRKSSLEQSKAAYNGSVATTQPQPQRRTTMPSKKSSITVADCKSIIGSLSHSQGFYGRLYRDLTEGKAWAQFARAARKAGCTDTLSLILWIEG